MNGGTEEGWAGGIFASSCIVYSRIHTDGVASCKLPLLAGDNYETDDLTVRMEVGPGQKGFK